MLTDKKPTFKKNLINAVQEFIYESLYDAMMKSFQKVGEIDENNMSKPISREEMASTIANAGKDAINSKTISKLTDAIDEYIRAIGITVINTPTTLVSPAGPVSGVITIKPSDVQIS